MQHTIGKWIYAITRGWLPCWTVEKPLKIERKHEYEYRSIVFLVTISNPIDFDAWRKGNSYFLSCPTYPLDDIPF